MFLTTATLSGSTEHHFLVNIHTFQVLIFINDNCINVSAIMRPQGKLVYFILNI